MSCAFPAVKRQMQEQLKARQLVPLQGTILNPILNATLTLQCAFALQSSARCRSSS